MGSSGGRGLPGGAIARVRPGTIAAEMGLGTGDRLYSIDGIVPTDYIDYRYLTTEPALELVVVRPDGREVVYEVEKDPDEDLGLEFAEDIFGGSGSVKVCRNRCLFCFVDRLPPGMRPSLYLKDDDYRLSFLHGNFISLTDFAPDDLKRVASMRLSPLYVSVHATDPELRARLMGNPEAALIMTRLEELTAAGIEVHAQVVVCPGLNDGLHFDRTVEDLASLRPGLASVGVVPVGLTRYGPAGGPVRPFSALESGTLLKRLMSHHRRLEGFIYPADELFLTTGRKIPGRRFYGDFPQLQNGIGLARLFLDDLARLRKALRSGEKKTPSVPFAAVTASMARDLVASAVDVISRHTRFSGLVLEVSNEFLGPGVTVSGLLSGQDVLDGVRRRGFGAGLTVLIPGSCLRAGSTEFLDGLTFEDLRRETGCEFLNAGWLPAHMLEALKTCQTPEIRERPEIREKPEMRDKPEIRETGE